MVRVAAVAASHTAVDIFTDTDVSNVSSGPFCCSLCCCWLSAAVGALAVAGAPAVANFTAVAKVSAVVGDLAVAVVPALAVVLKNPKFKTIKLPDNDYRTALSFCYWTTGIDYRIGKFI